MIVFSVVIDEITFVEFIILIAVPEYVFSFYNVRELNPFVLVFTNEFTLLCLTEGKG